ncbi:hypothetical protein [Nocardiopsis potens]|uniref:hypothetical protein n=1 Tax=Nocardiopsis potens TaxID=1246458 RepID=UPI00034A4D86|nr:hypothetical protein [Nocardiopsis potens]
MRVEHQTAHPLLSAGDPGDWPRLLASVPDVVEPLLPRLPVSDELFEAVLADGRAKWLEALARNERMVRSRPDLRDRLIATGRAAAGRPLLSPHAVAADGRNGRSPWPLSVRRAVLAAARPADWPPGGELNEVLGKKDVRLLRAAVACPLPGMARAALEGAADGLTRAERLRALLTVYEHDGGPAALEEVLAAVGEERLSPEAAAEARKTLEAGGPEPLRAAAERAEGTRGAIEELYDTALADRAEQLELRTGLDWAAVAEAAARVPFDDTAAGLLAARADCPAQVRDALFAQRPRAVAAHAAHLDAGLLAVGVPKRDAARVLLTLCRRGLGRGIGGAELLCTARPAAAVLAAARRPPEHPEGRAAWEEFTEGLAALVAEHLGGDVERWRAVRARLTGFTGTVPELLAAEPPARAKPGGAWPGAGAAPTGDRVPDPAGARGAFTALADAAADPVCTALLPHLDDRAVYDLLGHGRLRDGWFALAAGGDPRYRTALASRPTLDADGVRRLMELDDPGVNARLFLRPGTTPVQRERLLSGRPCRPGAAGEVPLDPGLVERLLQRKGGFSGRDPVDCADPALQRHLLRHVRVRGRAPQLRLLLNLWERRGPEAVADLLGEDLEPVAFTSRVFRQEVRKTVEELLGAEDRDKALEELRAQAAEGESASAQIRELRGQHFPGAELFRHSHAWHWAEIAAEHRRDPLPSAALAGLAELPDVPEDFRKEAEAAVWRSDADYAAWETLLHTARLRGTVGRPEEDKEEMARLRIGPDWTGERILRSRPAHYDGGIDLSKWLTAALEQGAVAPGDVIEHAPSAVSVLKWMWGGGKGAEEALAAAVREHLGSSPDAWVLALRMLPGFRGTLGELLRTAGAAAG